MKRKLIQKAEGQNRAKSQQSAGSRIASISIDSNEVNTNGAESLTYDDIINMKTNQKSKERVRGEASVTSMPKKDRDESLPDNTNEKLGATDSRRVSIQSNKSTGSVKSSERNIQVKINLMNPVLANDLVITNTNKADIPPGRPVTPVNRKGSAKSGKLISGKPTSAASSTSISAHGPKGDTSFISFTQQICVNKDHINKTPSTGSVSGLSTNEVIDSVRDHNDANSDKPGTDMASGIVILNSKPSTPIKSPNAEPKMKQETENRPKTPENSPTREKSEYAFDIPTAQREDSEVNSMHDPNDLDDKVSRASQRSNSMDRRGSTVSDKLEE